MKNILSSMLFFLLILASAQTKIIQGQLLLGGKGQEFQPIDVLNKRTQEVVSVSSFGIFSLAVAPQDSLVLTSLTYKEKHIVVDAKSFAKGQLFIPIEIDYNELDKIMINQFYFTGNLKQDITYNRPLLSSFKNIELRKKMGLPILKEDPEQILTNKLLPEVAGIPIPLGVNINVLSDILTGKYRRKQEYLAERKKQQTINEILAFFRTDFYTQTLKIPQSQMSLFVIAACESFDMETLVNKKDFGVIEANLRSYASIYLKIYYKSMPNNSSTQTAVSQPLTDSLAQPLHQ